MIREVRTRAKRARIEFDDGTAIDVARRGRRIRAELSPRRSFLEIDSSAHAGDPELELLKRTLVGDEDAAVELLEILRRD